jgi:hypothetical protein
VVEERDAGPAEGERILHRVDLLQDRRGDRPALLDAVGPVAPRPVPDVPLVEAEHDALRRAAPRRHRVGDGDHLLDEGVHEIGRGEEKSGVLPA